MGTGRCNNPRLQWELADMYNPVMNGIKELLRLSGKYIYDPENVARMRRNVEGRGLCVCDFNGVLTTRRSPFLPNLDLLPVLNDLRESGVVLWVWTTAQPHREIEAFVNKNFPCFERVISLDDYEITYLKDLTGGKKARMRESAIFSAGWLTEAERTALQGVSPNLKSPEIFTKGPVVIVEDGPAPVYKALYPIFSSASSHSRYYQYTLPPFGQTEGDPGVNYLPHLEENTEALKAFLTPKRS